MPGPEPARENQERSPGTLFGAVRALARRLVPRRDRRVARQTFWTGGVSAIEFLGGLATISITVRILGPEGYGALGVIIAAAGLVHGVLALPGGDTVTAFVARSVAEGRREEATGVVHFTLASAVGMSLLAYATIAALVLTGRGLLGIDEAYAGAALLYAVTGVLNAGTLHNTAVLRLADRMSLLTVAQLVRSLTLLGMLSLVWLTGGGLLDIVWAYVASAAAGGGALLAATAVCASHAGLTGFLRSRRFRVAPDVWRYHTGTFGMSTLGAVTSHLDILLVAQLASVADAGIYRAARRIVHFCRVPLQSIGTNVQPEFSRLWFSREGMELGRAVRQFTLVLLVTGAAGFGLLALLREPVANLLLGGEFTGAATVMLFLIPGALLDATAVYGRLPIAIGRIGSNMTAMLAGLAVFAVLALLLMPQYGAEGAAWSRTAYSLVYVAVLAPFVISILRESSRLQ